MVFGVATEQNPAISSRLMTADANDPLSGAILEYLYELTRTLAGTHWQETIGGWIAVNVGKRTGATRAGMASALAELVAAGWVRERQQLRLLSSGRAVDLWVYSITGSGIVELKGEPRISTLRNRPIKALPVATDLGETHFRGLDIHLLDFAQQGIRIAARTFDDCLISGPAVIDLQRTHLDDQCVFFVPETGDATVLIEPQRSPSGVLPVDDCIFRNCSFRNVAVVSRLAHEPPLPASQTSTT